MTPAWIVSFGYGTKFAFDRICDATEFVEFINTTATQVESVYINDICYWKEDIALISIMQGSFITKEKEAELRETEV